MSAIPQNRSSLESDDVRQAARGRWLEILAQLAPELEPQMKRPGRHGRCPVHGGKDGFRLFRDVPETGGGICNTCGPRPDGFALLQWLKGWSFPETLEAVAGVIGASSQSNVVVPVRPRIEVDFEARRRALAKVWREAVPITHPAAAPVRYYFRNRGLRRDMVFGLRDLKLHPHLPYWEDHRIVGRYPALLALMRDNEGKVVSIHRTWLHEGAKAPVKHPRMLMKPVVPRIQGAAVRMTVAGDSLGIAEGIETALAVRQKTGLPVWATTSWTFMIHFRPPPGIRRVIIWADLDRNGTGLAAADRLADSLKAAGIQAIIRVPEGPIPEGAKSLDWNDVFRLAV